MSKKKSTVQKKVTINNNNQNQTKMESNTRSLFERLFTEGGDAHKGKSYGLAERSQKRAIQAAYDSGAGKIDELEFQIMKEREKLHNMDINQINLYRSEIEAVKKTMEYTEQEYKELFDKEIENDTY